jgi:hypothetical protein
VGNAGEGGSSSPGGLLNEGIPLVWVVLKDPFAGARPFFCLVLIPMIMWDDHERDKERVTYSFLVISPVFVK